MIFHSFSPRLIASAWLSALCLSSVLLLPVANAQLPQASVYDEETEDFLPYEASRLDDIEGYSTRARNLEFSDYGGWKARRVEATGFFRVEQIDGRWWVIDPEGYFYIHKAVNSVQLFGDFSPDDVYELLPTFGMNGTGNFSDEEVQDSTLRNETPLAYCPRFSFVSTYNRSREDRLPIPVFDDDFVTFCQERAVSEFSQFVNDPQVLGYFIDNELSWTFRGGLESHIDVNDPNDKNYQAAVSFLQSRGKDLDEFNDDDADDYAAIMVDRYLSVVCPAVRAVDPNHMILGPRFNKSWNRNQAFMEAVGRHLDIVGLNHYHRWGTRSNELENVARWTGRPVLISEFYAMEKIPNFEETGAGWRVEDETSRALFYEHFLTTQLKEPYMVGFHWFNFQDDFADNDSTQTVARRGLIDIDGEVYEEVRASMKYMNDRIYDYIEFVDVQPSPDAVITSEADAYFQDDNNFGSAPDMLVRRANTRFTRSAYVRFDASSLTGDIASAKIQLFGTSLEEKLTSRYRAELVTNNNWSENSINADNAPPASTLLETWSHGDDIEIDVTEELIAAMNSGAKISIRISDDLDNDLEVEYGAREHVNAGTRPKLVVYYEQDASQGVTDLISSENFEDSTESDLGNWNQSGVGIGLYTGERYSHQGRRAAELRGGNASSGLQSEVLNLAAYSTVSVDFCYIARDLVDGDEFSLQISTNGGGSYSTVQSWRAGRDFNNEEFKQASYETSAASLTDNTLLRFSCSAASNTRFVYLDDIVVSASGRGSFLSYEDWLGRYAGVEDEDSFRDTDGDGVETVLEYVLNGNADEVDEGILPVVAVTDEHFVFSYQRLIDSAHRVDQVFEYSSDMIEWHAVQVTGEQDAMVRVSTGVGGNQEVRILVDRSATTEDYLFGRLRVLAPR